MKLNDLREVNPVIVSSGATAAWYLRCADKRLAGKHSLVVGDIGCTNGGLRFGNNPGFWGKVRKLYGCDYLLDQLRAAKSERGYQCVLGDARRRLPFGDEAFDVIFAMEIIEHIEDTDSFLAELRRCLKKGGVLCLSTPNVNSMRNRIFIPLGRYPSGLNYRGKHGESHIRAYNADTLLKHVAEHGIDNLRLHGNTVLPTRLCQKIKPLAVLNRLLTRFFPKLAPNVLVTGVRLA